MVSSLIANYVHIAAAMKTRSLPSTPGRPVHAAAVGAQDREVAQHTPSRRANIRRRWRGTKLAPSPDVALRSTRIHGPGFDPNQRQTAGLGATVVVGWATLVAGRGPSEATSSTCVPAIRTGAARGS
jgi:hypothetical protein